MQILNYKLGVYASVVGIAHLIAGFQLGAFYHNQAGSMLDKVILRVIDSLYYVKDLF